jgi:hypothetical protein
VIRSQAGRLLVHIKLSKPDGKKPAGTGAKRLVDVKPHDGVARAGTAVNAASATTTDAMRSGRIRIFLN